MFLCECSDVSSFLVLTWRLSRSQVYGQDDDDRVHMACGGVHSWALFPVFKCMILASYPKQLFQWLARLICVPELFQSIGFIGQGKTK